ncbi:uncharacterized protein V6R79_007577 [Siganus canaliculatus]
MCPPTGARDPLALTEMTARSTADRLFHRRRIPPEMKSRWTGVSVSGDHSEARMKFGVMQLRVEVQVSTCWEAPPPSYLVLSGASDLTSCRAQQHSEGSGVSTDRAAESCDIMFRQLEFNQQR